MRVFLIFMQLFSIAVVRFLWYNKLKTKEINKEKLL